jgi:hypothetical protein
LGFGMIASRLKLAWAALTFAGSAATIVVGVTLLQWLAPVSLQTSGPLTGLVVAFGGALGSPPCRLPRPRALAKPPVASSRTRIRPGSRPGQLLRWRTVRQL